MVATTCGGFKFCVESASFSKSMKGPFRSFSKSVGTIVLGCIRYPLSKVPTVDDEGANILPCKLN